MSHHTSSNGKPISPGAEGYALIAGAERKCRVIDMGANVIHVMPLDGTRLASDGPGTTAIHPSGFYRVA